jgi:Leucine-rich repeat (LRR) protein
MLKRADIEAVYRKHKHVVTMFQYEDGEEEGIPTPMREEIDLMFNATDPAELVKLLIEEDRFGEGTGVQFVQYTGTLNVCMHCGEAKECHEVRSGLPDSITNLIKAGTLTNLNFSYLRSIMREGCLLLPCCVGLWKTGKHSESEQPVLTYESSRAHEIDGNIATIQDATQLDFSGFKLSRLPEVLQKIETLTNLNVSNNLLTAVPTFLAGLTSLVKLDLSKQRKWTANSSTTRSANSYDFKNPLNKEWEGSPNWEDILKATTKEKDELQKQLPNCTIHW